MPSTINASNTTGGIIATGDGSGILELQSGGTTGLTVNGANVTVAGTFSATGGVSGVNLTTGVTGVLPVANGGTNTTATPTAGGISYGTGTALAYTSAGTSGQALLSGGSGAPTWGTVSPSISATASGAITAGNPVVINSDGTVSAGTGRTNSGSTNTVYNPSQAPNGTADIVYDSTNGRIVTICSDSFNSYYGTYQVGTVSGSTITLQGQNFFYANYCLPPKATYSSGSNKVVIVFTTGGNIFSYIVGSTTSTAMTLGSVATIESFYCAVYDVSYDPVNDKVIVVYSSASGLQARVGTISGTTITWGAAATVTATSSGTAQLGITDIGSGKFAVVYNNGAFGNYTTVVVGSVSGTTITFGTPVQVIAYASSYNFISYDPSADRIVISYNNVSGVGFLVLGSVSGTTVTLGTPVQFTAGLQSYAPMGYETASGFMTMSYKANNYAAVQSFKISGSTITLGTSYNQYTTSVSNDFWGGAYITASPQAVLFVISANSSGICYWGKGAFTNITATNILGFSRATYANAATATVDVIGSVNSSQSGLTTGSAYYLTSVGALTTSPSGNTYAGIATSATSILVKG